ncbi:GpE family phage tail protein [Mannheimia haemolytica]|uniref:GpE family phage tail protein n=1 Tax=Mannheimia haemolytica TaxID=75985 RepID=UPI003C12C199
MFHWTPNAFDEMTIVELGQWREKARLRSGVESKTSGRVSQKICKIRPLLERCL